MWAGATVELSVLGRARIRAYEPACGRRTLGERWLRLNQLCCERCQLLMEELRSRYAILRSLPCFRNL